ncbi:hypothetical protein B0H14DRAFT_2704946 [Mycena olivaceomarginata]|nr:hypothetical protein B0H14DRAFT_2704946 [Mycena olivaceomarginata]
MELSLSVLCSLVCVVTTLGAHLSAPYHHLLWTASPHSSLDSLRIRFSMVTVQPQPHTRALFLPTRSTSLSPAGASIALPTSIMWQPQSLAIIGGFPLET